MIIELQKQYIFNTGSLISPWDTLFLSSKLNLTLCNFGFTVFVEKIPGHMPMTRIDGQLSSTAFVNNDEDVIIAGVKRDLDIRKEHRD